MNIRLLSYRLRVLYILAFICIPIAGVTTIVLSYTGTETVNYLLYNELSNSVKNNGKSNSAAISFNDKILAKENLNNLFDTKSVKKACLYTPNNKLFVGSTSKDLEENVKCPPVLLDSSITEGYLAISHKIFEGKRFIGTILVESDKSQSEPYKKEMLYKNFLTFFTVIFTFLIPLMLIAQRFISKPVSNLFTSTKTLTANNQELLIHNDTKSENEVLYIENTIGILVTKYQQVLKELDTLKYKHQAATESTKLVSDFLSAEVKSMSKGSLLALKVHELSTDNSALSQKNQQYLEDAYKHSADISSFVDRLKEFILETPLVETRSYIPIEDWTSSYLVNNFGDENVISYKSEDNKQIHTNVLLLEKTLEAIVVLIKKSFASLDKYSVNYCLVTGRADDLLLEIQFFGTEIEGLKELLDMEDFESRESLFRAILFARQNGQNLDLIFTDEGIVFSLELVNRS